MFFSFFIKISLQKAYTELSLGLTAGAYETGYSNDALAVVNCL